MTNIATVNSQKLLLSLILALALVRGVLFAVLIPPWQAPDEPAQFERAKAAVTGQDWEATSENAPAWYGELAESLFTFRLWDFLDEDRPGYASDEPLSRYIVLYNEAYGGLYGSRPTYAAMAWPLYFSRHDDLVFQLYLVRFNIVLMNGLIILLAYLTVHTIFPGNPFLSLGVPILILFNPQHTHLLSAVNNGNLAELLTTAALYFLVRGITRGFSALNITATLIFTILAMWTKATAYFLPLVLGCVSLFYLWRYRRRWYWLLPIGVILAGAVYLFAPERLLMLVSRTWGGLIRGQFQLDPVVPVDMFRTFWALPGWFSLSLHPFWYWLWLGVCLAAVIGWGIFLLRNRRLIFSARQRPRVQAVTALAIAVIVAITVPLVWNAVTNTIVYRQGRSIYPVIMPISLFLVAGWYQLVPEGWRKEGLLSMAAALFLFDSLVLWQYIVPFFYSRY